MEPAAKLLIIGGAAMIFFGLAAAGKMGPLGKLPGDITFKNGGFELYFPIATGIVLSIILSLILSIFRK